MIRQVKWNDAAHVISFAKAFLSGEERTLLALGSGDLGSEKAFLDFDSLEKITAVDNSIERLKKAADIGTKVSPIRGDVETFLWQSSEKYDIITLLDIVEHMKKEDSLKVLKDVDAHFNKLVMIFSPIQGRLRNDYDSLLSEQEELRRAGETMSRHLSLWTPEDFDLLGYDVFYDPTYHKDRFSPGEHWGAFLCIKRK